MTNAEILRIAMEQHAIDANCRPEDFLRDDNIVVISKPHKDARRYLNLPFFCDLISYGKNIVASVDERVYEFVKNYINTGNTSSRFETPGIHELTNEFAKYGAIPMFMAEYWLPDVDILKPLDCSYEMRLLERENFKKYYNMPEWNNALSKNRPHLDTLAFGAYDNGKLIGLAACSADCDAMWQIGIDVLPGYRRQGVAAALTSRLAVEILARGKVPFYCCAWSNLSSVRNAIKSGFRPAWVEHTAISRKAETPVLEKRFAKKNNEDDFWDTLDKLVADSKIIIDRPKDTPHPKYPDSIYPLDYGYLENTTSPDGSGIDIWKGSAGDYIDAIICTVDLKKKDSEIKILIGCTEEEKQLIIPKYESMKGLLIRRV